MMRSVSSLQEPLTLRTAVNGIFTRIFGALNVPVIVLHVAASTIAESFARPITWSHVSQRAFTRAPRLVARTRPATAAQPLWMPTSVDEKETESVPLAMTPGTSDDPCTTNCPPGHGGSDAAATAGRERMDSSSASERVVERMSPPQRMSAFAPLARADRAGQ